MSDRRGLNVRIMPEGYAWQVATLARLGVRVPSSTSAAWLAAWLWPETTARALAAAEEYAAQVRRLREVFTGPVEPLQAFGVCLTPSEAKNWRRRARRIRRSERRRLASLVRQERRSRAAQRRHPSDPVLGAAYTSPYSAVVQP